MEPKMTELAERKHPDALATLIRRIAEGQETTLDVAGDVLEFESVGADGKKTTTKVPRRIITVERRAVQPEPPEQPERFESPRRAHTFHDAAGFVAYLQRYGTKATVVLADHAEATMQATIDETAADGFETIRLKPIPHPLLEPWRARTGGSAYPIKEIARFLMENRRAITKPAGREVALLMSQVTASRSITRQAGIGAKSLNGIMIKTTIQGVDQKAAPLDLPETITIAAPIFAGQPPVPIEIDLLLDCSDADGTATARLTSHDMTIKRIEAFEAMVAKIAAEIKLETAVVALGTGQTEPWDYIRNGPLD